MPKLNFKITMLIVLPLLIIFLLPLMSLVIIKIILAIFLILFIISIASIILSTFGIGFFLVAMMPSIMASIASAICIVSLTVCFVIKQNQKSKKKYPVQKTDNRFLAIIKENCFLLLSIFSLFATASFCVCSSIGVITLPASVAIAISISLIILTIVLGFLSIFLDRDTKITTKENFQKTNTNDPFRKNERKEKNTIIAYQVEGKTNNNSSKSTMDEAKEKSKKQSKEAKASNNSLKSIMDEAKEKSTKQSKKAKASNNSLKSIMDEAKEKSTKQSKEVEPRNKDEASKKIAETVNSSVETNNAHHR